MSYQNVTGCLSQGAHPGSYNGQDAYNDMLVIDEVQNDIVRRGGETAQTLDASYFKGTGARNGKEREIIAEEPIMMSDRKGHNGITEDGRSTTLTAQEKERPVVACGYDSYNQTTTGEVSQTLKSQKGGDDAPRVVTKELPATEGGDAMTSVVRRLTPLE